MGIRLSLSYWFVRLNWKAIQSRKPRSLIKRFFVTFFDPAVEVRQLIWEFAGFGSQWFLSLGASSKHNESLKLLGNDIIRLTLKVERGVDVYEARYLR